MCLNICNKILQMLQDKAASKYQDETPKDDRTDAGVTAVMRAAIWSKTTSLRGQSAKHLAVANPKLGDQSLDEASAFF
jgi:hypothetical protein